MIRRIAIALATFGVLSFNAAEAQVPAPRVGAAFNRGWLGISFETPPAADGTLTVDEVALETPAARAGIQPGDRIVRWNGRTDVAAAVRGNTLAIGDTVRVRVSRTGGRDLDLTVVAEARNPFVERRASRDGDVIYVWPDEIVRRFEAQQGRIAIHLDSIQTQMRVLLRDSLGPLLDRARSQIPSARIEILRADSLMRNFQGGLGLTLAGGRFAVAGAELADVSPELGSYFGTESGALVLRVAPRSPAADAGLQVGDVIVAAEGEAIRGVDDLRRAVLPGVDVVGATRARIRVDAVGTARRDLPIEIIRRGQRYSLTLPR